MHAPASGLAPRPTRRQRALGASLAALAGCAFLAASARVAAFEVYSYVDGGETLFLKWGDNHAGSAGGTIAWSLIPAGTPGSSYCGNACPGVSGDSIAIENFPGGGFTSTPLASLEARIASVLERWSTATGIRFVRLPSDSGVAIDDPAAVPDATGHIRIGVFAFSTGGGVVGFAPPPNGGTGAGDVLFDSSSFYQFAPGAEGDAYSTTFAPNDFESVLLHELGHAIGLAHPPIDGTCPVMQVAPACLGRINRQLDGDDRAGATFLYGTLFADGFEGAG